MKKIYVDKQLNYYEDLGLGSSYEMKNGMPMSFPCRILKDIRNEQITSVPELFMNIQFTRVYSEINPMSSADAFEVVFTKLKRLFEDVSMDEFNQSYKTHDLVSEAVVNGYLALYYSDRTITEDFKHELKQLLGYVWLSFKVLEDKKNKKLKGI